MYGTVSDVLLQVEIEESIQETLDSVLTFLPRLIGALVILVVGLVLGRILGGVVSRVVDGVELDRLVLDTPLGSALGGTEQAISNAFGLIARWFVYALAILAAADVLAITVLSEWITDAVSYLPAFVAGLLIIVLGFVVADFIGDIIARTTAVTDDLYAQWIATGVQVFLYFVVIVIGLDTMGVDVEILFVFARALAWGLAAAIAIAAGIAFGLGGQDYVSNNIDRWTRQGKSGVTRSDGGVVGDDDVGRGDDAGPGDGGAGPPDDRSPE